VNWETENAYLAGIIDGEGSIIVRPKKEHKGGTITYELIVTVTNTNMALLEWIAERYGDYIYRTGFGSARPNCKQAYHWRVSGPKCGPILEAVFPFLIIKREQAELGLAFIKTIPDRNPGRRGYPDHIVAVRKACADRCKVLNQRGVHPSPDREVVVA
jgi:hypothetical protein